MKALNLPSEASMRFSKGIHPETVKPASERATELMRQHAGGVACKGLVDAYPVPPPRKVVNLSMREVRRQLGMDFTVAEATHILKPRECRGEPPGRASRGVRPPQPLPATREGAADLIEALVRISGYDRLPATLLSEPLPEQKGIPSLDLEERVRDLLVGLSLQ